MVSFYSVLIRPLLDNHVRFRLPHIKTTWREFRENDEVLAMHNIDGIQEIYHTEEKLRWVLLIMLLKPTVASYTELILLPST